MKYRGDLNTEQQNKKSLEIDSMEISEILRTINNEDASIANAVRMGLPEIEETINYAVSSVKNGGRIFYVGAGTSGRLGVLDASEIPPTFSASNDIFMVSYQAVIKLSENQLRVQKTAKMLALET